MILIDIIPPSSTSPEDELNWHPTNRIEEI